MKQSNSNIVVIGNSHIFSELELKSIKQHKNKIDYITEGDLETGEVTAQLDSLIDQSKKTIIILNISGTIPNELLLHLTTLEKNNNIHYLTISSFLEKYLKKMHIPRKHTDISFLEKIKPYSAFEYFLKRVVDYAGVASLLVLFWPFVLYSVYRIKKESPNGSVLFKQKRVGLCGKEFMCMKFRSMGTDAEKEGAQFATKDDPRVFPWGRTMRKTRIDELPQIINIIKGEMHLVGPRPERKIWVEQFEKEIPYYGERHLVRPGITGWAQVKYPYGANTEDARQKLMYDLYYMKEWSLLLELKTILLTVTVVLGSRGF